jgi:hypothetical protein
MVKLTNANCFESINKMSHCCVQCQQAAVLFDIFEAVTKSIILYIFGWSFQV